MTFSAYQHKLNPIDYLVIGAGIAGLGAAYEIKKSGKDVGVFEASNEPGGRMKTVLVSNLALNAGAGFLLSSYKNINRLIRELSIDKIPLQTGKRIAIRNGNQISVIDSQNFWRVLNG